MRWPKVTWLGLAVLVLSLGNCATPREPSPPDGRPCPLAFLDAEMVVAIQSRQMVDVRVGDVIMTQACLFEHADDTLNEIFSLTK